MLFQLILWSYILVTGLSKLAKTHLLLCHVKGLLTYSHVSDSLKTIAKSDACTQSCLLQDFVSTLWGTLFRIRRPFRQRFIRCFDVICISTSSNFASARLCWCPGRRSTPIQLRGIIFLCCQFVQTSNKKKFNFRKSGGKSKRTKSKSNEEDRKQHVSHLNLLNISTIVSIQSSFLRSGFNLNGLLVVFDPLHLISPWFAWISHRISWNGLFFSNTLPYFRKRPRRSFRLNPGIYIRRPKQGTSRFSSRSQNHEQDQVFINIVHFLSVRDYCAKRLQYWDQQYYCNHAQHIFFPAFFLTQH